MSESAVTSFAIPAGGAPPKPPVLVLLLEELVNPLLEELVLLVVEPMVLAEVVFSEVVFPSGPIWTSVEQAAIVMITNAPPTNQGKETRFIALPPCAMIHD